ncbi:hypothetical protein [Pontibaca methylaminivorans]|uniref:Uncharacterized protein n=1 Tax=Pontibaca methylaminivorans TaxID=515897 RepID=A0A1R3WZZ3_9RHOB|nr:hypothetical protein [Pontibaca methylaminivorans]SIT83118.1 hypothetical protein SAMN05421849_1845 [Pontibaca methylaminivorans]
MIVKIVLLFLIGFAALAMFGKLRLPGQARRRGRRQALRCPSCGRYRIGRGRCPCEDNGHG